MSIICVMNLQSLQNETILMFGKPRAFSYQEFELQLSHHNLIVLDEATSDVTLIIEGRMMNPYEQNKSDQLYEELGIKTISIDQFEKILVENINERNLLMSLKLSRDKERLKSFIMNSCISDTLFFQLIKMYNWGGEDFFDNDSNRDVSAAFIKRFYENIERNHNVEYATTGFIHLISKTKRNDVLEAIIDLEPSKLHPKIFHALALNHYADGSLQLQLHKKSQEYIDEALSLNTKLTLELVDLFLNKEIYKENIAHYRILDSELFQRCLEMQLDVALAHNTSLSKEMQYQLFMRDKQEIFMALAQNSALDIELFWLLETKEDESLQQVLLQNPVAPQEFLQKIYEKGIYLDSLAKNENTPVEILYQLQLDSRYERYVKTNAAFGKHIQSHNIGWII